MVAYAVDAVYAAYAAYPGVAGPGRKAYSVGRRVYE